MRSPDLSVEVPSPVDDPRHVLDGVGECLSAGVRLVRVIDPRARRAVVHRSASHAREVPGDGVLDGEDVVLGLPFALAEVLGCQGRSPSSRRALIR